MENGHKALAKAMSGNPTLAPSKARSIPGGGRQGARLGSTSWHFSLAILGILALVAAGVALEDEIGLPWDTTYRAACAAACIFFVHHLGSDYAGEQWPRTALWIAVVVNVGVFFTPLVDRPTSRGELMLFALPTAIVFLSARLATYSVANDYQRAMRQQMILGLVVAVIFCVILFGFGIMESQAT